MQAYTRNCTVAEENGIYDLEDYKNLSFAESRRFVSSIPTIESDEGRKLFEAAQAFTPEIQQSEDKVIPVTSGYLSNWDNLEICDDELEALEVGTGFGDFTRIIALLFLTESRRPR